MAVSVQLPDLGEGMAGGVVAEWYMPDGATVDAGEAVCRVESSFIAVEVEAGATGCLKHAKPAGSIERPGTVLALILAPGEPIPPPAPSPGATQAEAPLPTVEPAPSPDDETGETPAAESGRYEFEEQLVEAVVVPFPRRFAGQRDSVWGAAPGDAVVFDSSLFGDHEGERTETLPEPGASIPGLPLWELDDALVLVAENDAPPSELPAPGSAEERFARISAEAEASAQVLAMSVSLQMVEAGRLVRVSAREWADSPAPDTADVVFYALAQALSERGRAEGAGGLVVAEEASDVSLAIASPAGRSLRQCVETRAAGGDAAFEGAAWSLVSLAAQGITSAQPRLAGGHVAAFAIGAPGDDGSALLTMAYDSGRWGEGSAARLLARARTLIETPYAMLV